jgi:excisionase family DNA binding protein
MKGIDLRTTTRPYVSPLALAEFLDVSRRSIYHFVEKGALPAIRVGRQLRIPTDAARQFVGLPPPIPHPPLFVDH